MNENSIKDIPDSKNSVLELSANNVSIEGITKKVYKYQGIEIVEVNRATIDKIRQYTDKAMPKNDGSSWRDILNRPFWKDVCLGLFGTFVGLIVEGSREALTMLQSKDGGLPGSYVFYLLAAIITFGCYRKRWNVEDQSIKEVVDLMKQIQEEIDSIFENAPVANNDFADNALPSLDNRLTRQEKK